MFQSPKILVVTSIIISVCGIIALMEEKKYLGGMSFTTGLISSIYMYNPVEKTIRRMLDIITARVSFVMYLTHLLYNSPEVWHIMVSCMLCLGIAIFYYLSCVNEKWVPYHFLFHLLVIGGKIFVIYNF